MSEFYSALMLARHVSDLTGPSTAPDDGPVSSETCQANISAE